MTRQAVQATLSASAAAANPSIRPSGDPSQQYVLRIADSCLILSQRLAEWCGHAPVLEEDIALANMALDLLGQARALLTHAGAAQGLDEDQLAFLRDERDYLNLTLVELPMRRSSAHSQGGDFADTVVRNLLVSTWLALAWQRLTSSTDETLAAVAAKAAKEARYHRQHAADWTVRLGDGSDESHRRMQRALQAAWPHVGEMFDADAVDAEAVASGLGPSRAELREPWREQIAAVLAEATLAMPADSAQRSTGTRGVHSEHMGFILAEMQWLQRRYPGGRW